MARSTLGRSGLKNDGRDGLSYFPKLGRPAEEFGEDIRKLVHQNYTILYKIITEDEISVITIYRQNLPSI